MRFTFLIPNTSWFGKRYWHHFPCTEALLIAVLKQAGHEVDVIDANINNFKQGDLIRAIKKQSPDIIGISAMALEYRETVHKSFAIVKEVNPNIITVLGGIYPTLSPEIATTDMNIDHIIQGEGEDQLLELVNHISGVSRKISYGWPVQDLSTLPLPDYSPFDMQKYMNYSQKYNHNFRFKRLPETLF